MSEKKLSTPGLTVFSGLLSYQSTIIESSAAFPITTPITSLLAKA